MSLEGNFLPIIKNKPQGADTSFSLASKQVLREVSEKFAISDESLLRLYGIFGSTFERALELHELERVKKICVKSEPGNSANDARWLLQVTGISGEIYTLFPEVNFCSCASFRYRVLNDQAEHTCKHILAAWLSSVDNKKLSVQEIASPLFRDLMRFQVTF
ncbi:zinc finger SWIM domain-containing protein 7-like [Diprion similis]|uniref:zinc finger SWIM domain-containing protein 7-like n=1 Tax=Diprion similis TaxID=362088 RepID=UPI001EF9128F|nr:zinc finger SWIM domain-containing protein 7-like [Diprion similis]